MTESAVKLYIMNVSALEKNTEFDLAYDLIPKARQEKIDAISQADKKRQSLGAALLLTRALFEFDRFVPIFQIINYNLDQDEKVEEDYYDLAISYNESGKPYLPDYPDFHFNIAHSGEYAILAVSKEEVGCDIEKLRDINDSLKGNLSSEEFLRLWTLKESHDKLFGTGLKAPIKSLENYAPDDAKFTRVYIPGYQCYVATIK